MKIGMTASIYEDDVKVHATFAQIICGEEICPTAEARRIGAGGRLVAARRSSLCERI